MKTAAEHALRQPSLAPVLSFAFGALALGTLIALGLWYLVGVLLLAVIAIAIGFHFRDRHIDNSGWLLWFGWGVILVAHGTHQMTGLPSGYLLELFLFALSIAIAVHVFSQAAVDRTTRIVLTLWIGYLALSILSTALGRSHAWPALWQLQYNLKWPLMLGLGLMLAWTNRTDQQFRHILAYSWLIFGCFVALEIASPGTHQAIFGTPTDWHRNPLIGVGQRYRGPFPHAGYLALTAALFSAASLVQYQAGRGRIWLIPCVAYFGLLVASGQRQEFLAYMLVLLVFAAAHGWRMWYVLVAMAGILSILLISSLGLLDKSPLFGVLAEWGLVSSTNPLSERAILTYAGISVANDYFPLGSGLGTYGGAGAQKFDQSLFLELGFMRYAWFRQGLFLVDTFWPNVIAEAGLLGAALLAMLFGVLWLSLYLRARRSMGTPYFTVAMMALAAITLMIGNSPSSGALADPRSSFLFWMLIGCALKSTTQPCGRPDASSRKLR